MATKKATARKSTLSRATAAKKTTKKPVAVSSAAARAAKPTSVAALRAKEIKSDSLFPVNLPNIILAELLGTFILTMVAIAAFAVSPFMTTSSGVLGAMLVDPLFIGLTLALLVMGIGAVSGAHINPAVTFGFWAMRRMKTVMVPVYWLSQFLGALLAVGVANIMTSGQFVLNLGSFTQFNLPLMFIELIGMAIFMFGIAGVASRLDLSAGAKAWGVGIALTVALVAGASMLTIVQKAEYKKYADQAKAQTTSSTDLTVGRAMSVDGAVLNPAVALAVREDSSVADRLAQKTSEDKVAPSRFGLEVIVGTLVGAALGGNLYLLVAYRPKNEA